MSTEALLEIQKILLKQKCFAKVTTWYEEGKAVTKILLRDDAGAQPNIPHKNSSSEKKKKNPSRIRRASRRMKAHLAKMAGNKSPVAEMESQLPQKKDDTLVRLPPTPSGQLQQDLDLELVENVGITNSPIPQLDGDGWEVGEMWDEISNSDTSGGGNTVEETFESVDNKLSDIFRWAIDRNKEIKEMNEKKTRSNDILNSNDETDNFDDLKQWALSQKKHSSKS